MRSHQLYLIKSHQRPILKSSQFYRIKSPQRPLLKSIPQRLLLKTAYLYKNLIPITGLKFVSNSALARPSVKLPVTVYTKGERAASSTFLSTVMRPASTIAPISRVSLRLCRTTFSSLSPWILPLVSPSKKPRERPIFARHQSVVPWP